MGTVCIADDCRDRGYLDRNRVKHTNDIALARMLGEVEAMTEGAGEGRDRNRE
jgi:hypothetical protein